MERMRSYHGLWLHILVYIMCISVGVYHIQKVHFSCQSWIVSQKKHLGRVMYVDVASVPHIATSFLSFWEKPIEQRNKIHEHQ